MVIMDSLQWISVNDRLRNGVQLVNKISNKKFAILLNCIASAENSNIFTKEELLKLEESLSLTEEELQLVIQSLLFIFKQSSKVILKLTDLHKDLVETLKFTTDKADEYVKVWSAETNKHFGDGENRWKLNNVCMELDLELNRLSNIPKVRMQLDVSDFKGNNDDIILELKEEEFINLYSTLENIQTKLDKIQI